MSEEVLHRLIGRLDRLERRHRRWKLTSTLTAAALGLIVLAGAAAPRSPDLGQQTPTAGTVFNEVRAKRFLLVDDGGTLRGVRGAATGGAVSLGFLDNEDKIRSVLIVDANGIPRLEMLATDDTRRAQRTSKPIGPRARAREIPTDYLTIRSL